MKKPNENRKAFPTWLDLLAVVGILLLANGLAGAAAFRFLGSDSGFAMFVAYAAAFALTITFALALARQRDGTTRGMMRFGFTGFNPALILWALILMLAANVVLEPLIEFFPPEWYDLVTDRIAGGGWATVTAVVMAPILEEMLFRGIIQEGLARKWGPWPGILLASAIFGLIHGIPQQIVGGFCLGIIIGFVYYKTRSLLSVIILHAINNALATFMNLFESEEGRMAERSLREIIGDDRLYRIVFVSCVLLLAVSLVISVVRSLAAARKER